VSPTRKRGPALEKSTMVLMVVIFSTVVILVETAVAVEIDSLVAINQSGHGSTIRYFYLHKLSVLKYQSWNL
jgi:hypothetical protein